MHGSAGESPPDRVQRPSMISAGLTRAQTSTETRFRPMTEDRVPEYYEVLQVSCSAEPETIHRVYRLLAQRLHPDNLASGDVERFQRLTEAYSVLSDPEQRAQYDV